MARAWFYLLISSILAMNQVHATINVSITILESAVAKGAVCLDGSPPTYYYYEGVESGVSNWIVYLQGGGWCNSTDTCLQKSRQPSGSSRSYPQMPTLLFSGILDDDCVFNPDFCQWNKVFIRYCDGSSFLSDVEMVDPRTNLTFRGARILNVTLEEMMAKGLGDAQNAILAGSSAGGLSTILHCDMFRSLLPNAKVKCVSDSGFFIRGDKKGVPGVELREIGFSKNVIETHKLANALPTSCTSIRDPDLCLFPEYLVDDIRTPLFIIDSVFDAYQVENNLLRAVVSDTDSKNCTKDITQCDPTILSILKDFRDAFIETLMKLSNSSDRGMFIHTCFRHVHIVGRNGWTCSSVDCNVLKNETIGQAVGDWYFERSSFREIDTLNESPFNCTHDDERTPNFNQKCFATLHP